MVPPASPCRCVARSIRVARAASALAAALLASSCADAVDGDDTTPAPGATFIALSRDFEGFRSWANVGGSTEPAGGHDVGTSTIYVNRPLPVRGYAFEVGTVLVRTLVPSGGGATQIHAMAKRGGAFNAGGAVGWEWFELVDTTVGVPLIQWRGANPPDGTEYSSPTGVTAANCNACHTSARANDFVMSAPLLGRP